MTDPLGKGEYLTTVPFSDTVSDMKNETKGPFEKQEETARAALSDNVSTPKTGAAVAVEDGEEKPTALPLSRPTTTASD